MREMRAIGILKQLPSILLPFAIAVVVAVMALRLLNGVPGYVQNLVAGPPAPKNVLDERLSYPSIEAAEKDLGVKVATPAYFPSYLKWPAASVRGQREPARVVSMLFQSSNGQQGLQIREVFWQGESLPFPVPEPDNLAETANVDVHGITGQLLLGSSEDGTPVNQIRWYAGGVHYILTTIYAREELLKIARSMQ